MADAGERPSGPMTWDEAARWSGEARSRNETIVFTNGCFDLIHPGHVHLLKAAASFGDRLIIGLNSDASVERLKGTGLLPSLGALSNMSVTLAIPLPLLTKSLSFRERSV